MHYGTFLKTADEAEVAVSSLASSNHGINRVSSRSSKSLALLRRETVLARLEAAQSPHRLLIATLIATDELPHSGVGG
jgi:hypothetical protein